jgi:hypothetical protein
MVANDTGLQNRRRVQQQQQQQQQISTYWEAGLHHLAGQLGQQLAVGYSQEVLSVVV